MFSHSFDNCMLNSVEIYGGNCQYASVKYDCVDSCGNQCKLQIPRLVLPTNNSILLNVDNIYYGYLIDDFGTHNIESDQFNHLFYLYPYGKTKRKMTLSEIENRLGYKIELIEEEDSRK